VDVKDLCIANIVRFQLGSQTFAEHKEPPQLPRLCSLILKVKDPKQRFETLIQLGFVLSEISVPIPDEVLVEGRALLNQRMQFESIDLWEGDQRKFFSFGTVEQQRSLIKAQLQRLRATRDYNEQLKLGGLIRYISQSRLPSAEQFDLLREVGAIAQRDSNRYLQALVASEALPYDANWAIQAIWKVMPADRGRSGKTPPNIDWTPPPEDAGDAIRWLDPGQDRFFADHARLMVSLWEFLVAAPAEDRDHIRVALCRSLAAKHHFAAAVGILDRVESPVQRGEALMELLRYLRKPTPAR